MLLLINIAILGVFMPKKLHAPASSAHGAGKGNTINSNILNCKCISSVYGHLKNRGSRFGIWHITTRRSTFRRHTILRISPELTVRIRKNLQSCKSEPQRQSQSGSDNADLLNCNQVQPLFRCIRSEQQLMMIILTVLDPADPSLRPLRMMPTPITARVAHAAITN
jgi:hypothetical protein